MQLLLSWIFYLAVVALLPPCPVEQNNVGFRPSGSSGLPGRQMVRLARLLRLG